MRWPYYLGHAFRRGNRTEKAAAAFTRALAVQPNHVPSLVWLAEMQSGLRIGLRPPAAARDRAQAIEPRSGAVLYGLGRAALADTGLPERGDVSRGRRWRLRRTPRAFTTRSRMAYRGLGNRQQAEAHLRQRGEVDLPPADPLMADVAGLLQNAVGIRDARRAGTRCARLAGAIDAARQGRRDRPAQCLHAPQPRAPRSSCSATPSRALEQYREAVRLLPSLARAHFGIGVLMETRGQDAAGDRGIHGRRDHTIPDTSRRGSAWPMRCGATDAWRRLCRTTPRSFASIPRSLRRASDTPWAW